jgi:hypothetical protein
LLEVLSTISRTSMNFHGSIDTLWFNLLRSSLLSSRDPAPVLDIASQSVDTSLLATRARAHLKAPRFDLHRRARLISSILSARHCITKCWHFVAFRLICVSPGISWRWPSSSSAAAAGRRTSTPSSSRRVRAWAALNGSIWVEESREGSGGVSGGYVTRMEGHRCPLAAGEAGLRWADGGRDGEGDFDFVWIL